MKWTDARKTHPNKWILLEVIEGYSDNGKRIVEEFSIINVYDEGKDALKDYTKSHIKDKTKELYVYHTKNEELSIVERNWIGVRKNG